MRFTRRSILVSPLAALMPQSPAAGSELFALGTELERLRHHVVTLHAGGIEGTRWARWNEAIEMSVAVADRIARTPARNLADFAIRIDALAWTWNDDVDENLLVQLRALACEMRHVGHATSIENCSLLRSDVRPL